MSRFEEWKKMIQYFNIGNNLVLTKEAVEDALDQAYMMGQESMLSQEQINKILDKQNQGET